MLNNDLIESSSNSIESNVKSKSPSYYTNIDNLKQKKTRTNLIKTGSESYRRSSKDSLSDIKLQPDELFVEQSDKSVQNDFLNCFSSKGLKSDSSDLTAANFESHLQNARNWNPDLNSDRMRNILLIDCDSKWASDSLNDDEESLLNLKMRYKKLKKKYKRQQKLIELLKAEYIDLCRYAESTQEDHYKLETVLRKSIADCARTIAKLRTEYKNKSKSTHFDNDSSTLKSCDAQMASAFSIMQSLSNKNKHCSKCSSINPRSDSMPRIQNPQKKIHDMYKQPSHLASFKYKSQKSCSEMMSNKCNDELNCSRPTRHTNHSSHVDGVLSSTFRRSIAKMSPRIAYTITQKITEVIKTVLANYQQEKDERLIFCSHPLHKSSQHRHRHHKLKKQHPAIGDNELCDLLHNIRALSPTTVRALSNLLHSHPLVDY